MKNLINKDELDVDNLPTRESARTPDGWPRHDNDMPWNKLHRFLECRVGNFWNDIFSEFVHLEWIPGRLKTREQLAYSVVLNTFMKDGRVYYNGRWERGGCEKPIEEYGYGGDLFYVHPTSGKLCHIRKKRVNYEKRHQQELDRKLKILGDYWQLYKKDGIWYEVKAETIPRYESGIGFGPELKPNDIILETKTRFMPSFKTILKRQLNSKELKKHGLTNDVKPIAGPRCKICGGLDCRLNHKNCSMCGRIFSTIIEKNDLCNKCSEKMSI